MRSPFDSTLCVRGPRLASTQPETVVGKGAALVRGGGTLAEGWQNDR